jgi:hypothetical protein
MVHRIQIAYVVCVCRDHCRRQVDFCSETIVRSDLHLGLLVFESSPPPLYARRRIYHEVTRPSPVA